MKRITFNVNMAVEYEVDDKRPHSRTLTIRAFNGAMFLKIAPHAVLFLPHIEHIETFLYGQFPFQIDDIVSNDTSGENRPIHNEVDRIPGQ